MDKPIQPLPRKLHPADKVCQYRSVRGPPGADPYRSPDAPGGGEEGGALLHPLHEQHGGPRRGRGHGAREARGAHRPASSRAQEARHVVTETTT